MNIINSSQNSPSKTNKVDPRRREAEIHVTRAIEKIEQQRQAHSERRHIKVLELTKSWKNDVLPHWNSLSDTKYVRELCAKGIPPSIRGQIWSLLIGNQLKISEETFNNLKTIAELSSRDFSNSEYNDNVINIDNQERDKNLSRFENFNKDINTTNNDIDNDIDRLIHNDNNSSNYNNSNDNYSNNEIIIKEIEDDQHNLDNIENNEEEDEDDDENYPDEDEDAYYNDENDDVNSNENDKDKIINNVDDNVDNVNYETPSSSYKDLSPAKIITSYDKTSPIRIKTDLNLVNIDTDHDTYESDDDNSKSPSTYQRKVLAGSTPGKPLFPGRSSTLSLIEYDLPRTFPTLAFFHDGGPTQMALEHVLQAYAMFRPDVGYVQGMSYIVGMLLLYMETELEAFQCLANLLGRRSNMDFYRLQKEAIINYVKCFDFFFEKFLPMLYKHMKIADVSSEMYLMDWNLALFSKALPLETAARIWDCYLVEGDVFIMRAALGILRMFAPKISQQNEVEGIMKILMHLPEDINSDELILNISQIKISSRKYEKIRTQIFAKSNRSSTGSRNSNTSRDSYETNGMRKISNSSTNGVIKNTNDEKKKKNSKSGDCNIS